MVKHEIWHLETNQSNAIKSAHKKPQNHFTHNIQFLIDHIPVSQGIGKLHQWSVTYQLRRDPSR